MQDLGQRRAGEGRASTRKKEGQPMRRRGAPLNRNRSRLALRGSSRHPQRGPPSFTAHRSTNAPPALLTRPEAQTAQGGVLLVMQKGKGRNPQGISPDGQADPCRQIGEDRPPAEC